MRNVLRKHFGFHDFRENQETIIKNILQKKDVFAVMPTGGGEIPVLPAALKAVEWNSGCHKPVNLSDERPGGCGRGKRFFCGLSQ